MGLHRLSAPQPGVHSLLHFYLLFDFEPVSFLDSVSSSGESNEGNVN